MGENNNNSFMVNVNWGMGARIDSKIDEEMRRVHELRNGMNYDSAITMQVLNYIKDSFLGEHINGKYNTITVEDSKLSLIDSEGREDQLEISSEDVLGLIEGIISEFSRFLNEKQYSFYSLDNEFIKLGLDISRDRPYLSLYLGILNNISEEFTSSKPTLTGRGRPSIFEGIDD